MDNLFQLNLESNVKITLLTKIMIWNNESNNVNKFEQFLEK